MILPWRWFRSLARLRPGEFYALENITFDVAPGAALGIMGTYRSGKSVLANLLSRLYPPERGDLAVGGRILLVNNIGGGFRPMLNLRENARFRAALLGVGPERLEAVCNEALAFAGLTNEASLPLFNLDPLAVRELGFSLALHVDCDVMVIDGIIGVGRASFREKAMDRLRTLAKERTMIVISNKLEMLRPFVSRALVLDEGRVVADGTLDVVAQVYERLVRDADEKENGSNSGDYDDLVEYGDSPADDDADESVYADSNSGRRRKEAAFRVADLHVDGMHFEYSSGFWFVAHPGDKMHLSFALQSTGVQRFDSLTIGLFGAYQQTPLYAHTLNLSAATSNESVQLQPGEHLKLDFAFRVPDLQKDRFGLALTVMRSGVNATRQEIYKLLILSPLTDAEPGRAGRLEVEEICAAIVSKADLDAQI